VQPYGTQAGDSISTAVTSTAPPHLQDLTDRARGYVEAASSANTRKAYASDWRHFTAWCRRQHLSPLPPDPEVVGLYHSLRLGHGRTRRLTQQCLDHRATPDFSRLLTKTAPHSVPPGR